jgi:hypothetical protein
MSDGNGVTKTADNKPLSDVDIERMIDAGERPPAANGKRKTAKSLKPEAAKSEAANEAAANEAAQDIPPAPTPAEIQAARDEIYARYGTPEPFQTVLNKLLPEEVMYVIGGIEHAYNSGLTQADDGSALHAAYERGKTEGADIARVKLGKLGAFTCELLDALTLLEGEQPDVQGYLRRTEIATGRFRA